MYVNPVEGQKDRLKYIQVGEPVPHARDISLILEQPGIRKI